MDWRKAAAVTVLAGAAVPCFASAPLSLTGPEVVKMDWNTLALRIADIDGDGRNDLAMIDNDSGKIEILFQNNPASTRHKERRAVKRSRWEPVLEDAAFWHDSVTMGGFGYDLVVGDFNGDGRPDFAYTGSLTPLTIRFQAADGTWDESWTYSNFKARQYGSTMSACDVDKDGKTDLVLMSDEEILVFRQGARGTMEEPRRYRIAAPPATRLLMSDVNGDGLPDILFLSGSDRFRRLSMRLQQSPGRFGPEIGFPLPNGSAGLAEVRSGKSSFYATIDGLTRGIFTFTIADGGSAPVSLATLQGRDYSTGNGKQGTIYAQGDFDGDGDIDIAFANPTQAEIRLMRQNATGDFDEPVAFPGYAKISSLSTLSTPGKPDRLVVTSSGEDVAGIVSYADGRLGFPVPLPTSGKSLAAVTGHFTAETTSIALLEKKDDEFSLVLLEPDGDGWKRGATLAVKATKRKPDDIAAAPILPDGRDAILLFAAKDPVRIFTVTVPKPPAPDKSASTEKNEGAMTAAVIAETAADSTVRSSCLASVDRNKLGFTDIDGDGVCEILAPAPGYLRALRLKADGTLEVAEQYNSSNPEADIKGPLFAKIGPRDGLLFYDDATDRLEFLTRDASDKVFRTAETLDWPSQNGIDALVLSNLRGKAGLSLLALSEDRISILPLAASSWKRSQKFPAYETDLDEIHYTQIEAGDLTGDGTDEIVAADGNGNLLEILQEPAPDKPYASLLHFVVFEENPHVETRSDNALQPREMLIGDLDHDGRNDLALLIHDRVLIYLSSHEALAPTAPTAPAASKK